MTITIEKINQPLLGETVLESSKSISNRALIIQALSSNPIELSNLSPSKDTKVLQHALQQDESIIDVGHAGTAYRFLTAYLALQKGTYTLKGSSRMHQRPIAPLVNVLRQLGAEIKYLGEEGFPPLQITTATLQQKETISIPGHISSQFISSLLMTAPCLDGGLVLEIEGKLVSKPYVDMTLGIMKHFGIESKWEDNSISVQPQAYSGGQLNIEADWSSASYLIGLAGSVPDSKIVLHGLQKTSLQGDAIIFDIMNTLGVNCQWDNDAMVVTYTGDFPSVFEYNFTHCPDLAQTVIVFCATHGILGLFSGLETLRIKETDRIVALQKELEKGGCYLSKIPSKFNSKSSDEKYMLEGKFERKETIELETYNDHRMAMSLSLLAAKNNIAIEDKNVVEKSYPSYWEALQLLGVRCN